MLVLINERAAAFWHYCYIIVATTTTTTLIFVATYERDIVMKTFAFTDSDRIVVVKKSQGEMTVTIKLKDADKDSQKKINFMPCRLVSVLLYGTTTIIVIKKRSERRKTCALAELRRLKC